MSNGVDYLTIANLFAANDWHWNIDEESRVPDVAAIESTVQKMRVVLEESNELESQITVGHLIMQRDHDYYDVYVHTGTLSAS